MRPHPRTRPLATPLPTPLSLSLSLSLPFFLLLLPPFDGGHSGHPGPWCSASALPDGTADHSHRIRQVADIPSVHDAMAGGTSMVLAGHADGMRDMEVRLLTLAPGSASPIHSHPNEEVIVSMRGKGWVLTLPASSSPPSSGAPLPFRHPLGTNCTATLAPGLVHQVQSAPDEALQLLMTISDPPVLRRVFPSWEEAAAAEPAPGLHSEAGEEAGTGAGSERGREGGGEEGSEEGSEELSEEGSEELSEEGSEELSEEGSEELSEEGSEEDAETSKDSSGTVLENSESDSGAPRDEL